MSKHTTRTIETCLKRSGESRSRYETYDEAERSAGYARINYELELEPALCDECAGWHLVHANRGVYGACGCTGGCGKPKSLYASRSRAESVAQARADSCRRLRVYECPEGRGWHLTSSSGW